MAGVASPRGGLCRIAIAMAIFGMATFRVFGTEPSAMAAVPGGRMLCW
jgi:hypothetical protein